MLRKSWPFFVLTFAISWLLWLPGVLRSNGIDNVPEIPSLGIYGPVIAAFILVGIKQGWAGMGRPLRRAWQTGFAWRWWWPTLLLLPLIGLITVALMVLLGVELPAWSAPDLATALITPIFILFLGGGLEEFGWRGYALDRMQTGQNALVASLVLGFFWGLWHLPLFFIDTTVYTLASIPLWQFILQQMLLAVLYTWIYNNTGGTLLLMIIFHTLGNTSSALLPPWFATELGRWLNFGVLIITAVVVATVWGWRALNRDQPVPQPSLPADS